MYIIKFFLFASPNDKSIVSIEKVLLPNYEIALVQTLEKCLNYIKIKRPEILFLDISLIEMSRSKNDYQEVLKKFWDLYPSLEIIALASLKQIPQAVKAIKAGVRDYLTYPIKLDELQIIIESAKERVIQQFELEFLRKQLLKKNTDFYLGSESLIMKEVSIK